MSQQRRSGAPEAKAARASAGFAYPLFRVGAKARQLLFAPPDPWPRDPALGRRMVASGESLAWGVAAETGEMGAHRFGWLGDLRAAGGDAARARGQSLVKDWVRRHGLKAWRPLWTPPLLADRIVNWIVHFDFFGRPAPQSWKGPFFASLALQARTLARAVPGLSSTAARVRALHALVAFGAAVPGAQARLDRALALLRPVLEKWPPNGVIAERNPSDQLAALRSLIGIRSVLAAAHHEPLPPLEAAIARAGRALAALRHGDGRLALFHGGLEEDPRIVGAALTLSGAAAVEPHTFSGGFERAAAGEMLLLLDAAPPPPRGHDGCAHAGMLAFELGAGAQRLVVNCGAYYGRDEGWRAAGRMTAAHSTLTVGDRNSAELQPGGGIRRGPAEMTLDRQEDQGAVWIAASHDGYLGRFGILHRRRLFFAADGADLRGEDRIAPAQGRRIPKKTLGTPFAIRFHLHPALAVGETERDPDGITAVPFASAESGPWHLIAGSRLAAAVEESFYLGRGGSPERTRQIVLSGTIDDDTGIEARWAIKRMS